MIETSRRKGVGKSRNDYTFQVALLLLACESLRRVFASSRLSCAVSRG